MKTRRVVLLVLVNILSLGTAFAQDTSRGGGATARAAMVRTQEYTFGDQLVTSQLPVPDQATVRGRPRTHGISLLPNREHFVPEMLKSVENL